MSRVDWAQLPEGVLQRALCSLPLPDQGAARLICRLWRDSLVVQSLKSSTLTSRQLNTTCNNYPNLTSINLTSCYALTASSLRPLFRLSKLTSLCLSQSEGLSNAGRKSFLGLENLVGLKRLEFIDMDIGGNAMQRVGQLQGLTYLAVCLGIAWPLELQLLELQKLTNLRSVRLTIWYSEPSPTVSFSLFQLIEALPYLCEVDFTGTALQGQVLRAFQKHNVVQALKLSRCHNLCTLEGLEDLPRLGSLNLESTHIVVADSRLRRLPALTNLRVRVGKLPTEQSLLGLTGLRELALFPLGVLMTEGMCNQLLELPQLRILEICACDPSSWIDNILHMHLTSRLLTHPGLARLSWTHLGKDSYRSTGYVPARVVDLPARDRWLLVATIRGKAIRSDEVPLPCDVAKFAEYAASAFKMGKYMDIIFTRAGQ